MTKVKEKNICVNACTPLTHKKMEKEKEISKSSEKQLGHRCHGAQSLLLGGTVQGWVLHAGEAEGRVLEASLGWPARHPGLLGVLSWPP